MSTSAAPTVGGLPPPSSDPSLSPATALFVLLFPGFEPMDADGGWWVAQQQRQASRDGFRPGSWWAGGGRAAPTHQQPQSPGMTCSSAHGTRPIVAGPLCILAALPNVEVVTVAQAPGPIVSATGTPRGGRAVAWAAPAAAAHDPPAPMAPRGLRTRVAPRTPAAAPAPHRRASQRVLPPPLLATPTPPPPFCLLLPHILSIVTCLCVWLLPACLSRGGSFLLVAGFPSQACDSLSPP